MSGNVSVLIADDQDLVREGLRMLLQAEPGITVVGEAGTGTEAITAARKLDPDVVLMDVRMPGMDGIEAAAHLTRVGSRAKILMLTTFDLDQYVHGSWAWCATAVRILLIVAIAGCGVSILVQAVSLGRLAVHSARRGRTSTGH